MWQIIILYCYILQSVIITSNIAEAEFLSIAEKLKPFTKEKMKIEPFPWFPRHIIDMDKLYTELTLEKIEKVLFGENGKSLDGYKEMFNCHEFLTKVLLKADPGMGKTTLGKKVTKDWATGVFQKFKIVFFVALKFVKPGDPIENVILQQNPELEGLGISKCKLKALLNRFSSKILIIFDGLDEHGLGQNEDVLKIIKNQKLLDCGIVVSSRPHSVKEIEQHFPTIITVEGFTEKEASKFVSKFFTGQKKIDPEKIAQILQFKPSDSRENFPVHKCPMLLSFLCLLVEENEIDLLDRNLAIGDLYFRMVKCLYTKYTWRKGIKFEEALFHQVLISVGKLALQTLKSGNPLVPTEDIVDTAGEFAFEYGFLAGHENLKPSTDPTPGICLTYVHRSIEEFFGSFGFLQALDKGKSVEDILGSDCEKPIFMVNPLVFTFCLWLLKGSKCSQGFFGSPEVVYDKLVDYAAQRIDFYMLDILKIRLIYPILDIAEAIANKDSLKPDFFRHVFKACEHVRVLHVHALIGVSQIDGVLGLISDSLLNKLTLLSVSDRGCLPPHGISNVFTISIDCKYSDSYHEALKILLTRNNVLKRNPLVYTRVGVEGSLDISNFMQRHMKELHLCVRVTSDDSQNTLSASGEFPFCPQLAYFTAEYFTIDDSVPAAFMKAVKDGKFPNLRRIELNDCTLNDCEWPEVPEFSLQTKADTSQRQKSLENLTELTVTRCSQELYIDNLIPVRLEKLSILRLEGVQDHNLQCLNNILKQGNCPNLSELKLQQKRAKLGTFLEEFDTNHTAKLEKLALQQFTISAEEVEILGNTLASIQLRELDMSYSSGFKGRLSALFSHSFPRLNSLILRSCKLNSEDLQSLSRASVEGKLPQLRHLDISGKTTISDLFSHSAEWNQLKTLTASDTDILNVETNFLTSLEKLQLLIFRITTKIYAGKGWPSVTRCWSGLKVIELDKGDIHSLADGVERGMFPALTTVRIDEPHVSENAVPSLFKLHKANMSVVRTRQR